jgi:hypothetical protein
LGLSKCSIRGKDPTVDSFEFELLSKCLKTKEGNYNFALQSASAYGSDESTTSCLTETEHCPDAKTVTVYQKALCIQTTNQGISFISESSSGGSDLVITCSNKCASTFEYGKYTSPTLLSICLPKTESVCAKQILPFCSKNMAADFSSN